VTRVFRICFKKRILAHSALKYGFTALIELKSALFKIFDLKAERFRGIFAQVGRSKAGALREQIG
jgi:hypothetical protein